MIIFDTNVWIGFFHKNDLLHDKASKIFSKIPTNTSVLIPEYIFLEVATILAQKANKATANAFVEIVGNNRDYKVLLSTSQFFRQVTKKFYALDSKQLSFVDVALLCLSEKYTIVTFDLHLQKELKKKVK